ncbi:class III poly(R)-hydroxyalkanoic acid synthase subunit PhaE [Lysobacter sp. BMK333-48F3]|uniref:class III poly(R)-hydroxyalkanoic acid synthase subunit PhaE n=1 Tax=Lysobacter sp. BMK333-48F3 TaxID=2867962 RepID=UPI001C8C7199|nr:class III poly(R)-hydroxyalkanoic acid synthase subunit PhaE [Lysobacter sp. BMK333-48F3]MBX9403455.1 class III poly(R)-hydroxyalkanoic acid synthase subunit PhaE [Lysobacter sp. BMK333-48F3]
MANFGFGSNNPGGFGAVGSDGFEQLARQYWGAWGEMMRGAAPQPAQPSMPGWNEAVQWWSQLAKGSSPQADDTLDRFNSQARAWFGEIQKLAAQFAGRDASAADIAGAWKQAMGGQGGNPFADVFGAMRGPGQQDFSRWVEQIAPYLQNLHSEGRAWLGVPALGFSREHQERVQHLGQAYLDYQQRSQAYNALMAEAAQDAFARFENKLAERSEPGRQIGTARALFDLWIDAAEEAYAEIALSPRFRGAYADLVNSQMRLRAGVQKEIEQTSSSLGMPTRTEIDAAHRKIVQLERELRRLRDELQSRSAPAGAPAEPPRKPAAASKPAAAKPASSKPAASKPAASKPKAAKPRAAQAVAAAPSVSAAKPAVKPPRKTAIARPQPPARPAAVGKSAAVSKSSAAKPAKKGAR